jgi:hypothetical protein
MAISFLIFILYDSKEIEKGFASSDASITLKEIFHHERTQR